MMPPIWRCTGCRLVETPAIPEKMGETQDRSLRVSAENLNRMLDWRGDAG
jgi:hypothetical protein